MADLHHCSLYPFGVRNEISLIEKSHFKIFYWQREKFSIWFDSSSLEVVPLKRVQIHWDSTRTRMHFFNLQGSMRAGWIMEGVQRTRIWGESYQFQRSWRCLILTGQMMIKASRKERGKWAAWQTTKESCNCGDAERKEAIANCKLDRKSAKMRALTAA